LSVIRCEFAGKQKSQTKNNLTTWMQRNR